MLRNVTRVSTRCFSTSLRVSQEAIKPSSSPITPSVSTTTTATASQVKYDPQVFTPEEVLETTKTPLPINVELNYYAPLRHKKRYGDLVAEIQLRAYDHENLDFFGDFALRAAYYLDIPASGVVPLPTKRERWTVIRAPFVHAKSKENFLRLTHKRVIKAYDATPEVIDLWVSYLAKHSNSGVGIKVTTYQRESVNLVEELDKTDLSKLTDLNIEDESLGGQGSHNVAIAKRVQELLNDPVFKRHLKTENVEGQKEQKQVEQ